MILRLRRYRFNLFRNHLFRNRRGLAGNDRRQHRQSHQQGFTLVELLVVMGVGMIGLTGLMALIMTSLKGNQTSAAAAEAVEVCEESMEELRSMTIEAIETLGSPYGPIDESGWGPVAHHSGSIFGRNNIEFRRTVEARALPAPQFDHLILLRVNVEWAEAGADLDTDDGTNTHRVYLEMLRNREDQL